MQRAYGSEPVLRAPAPPSLPPAPVLPTSRRFPVRLGIAGVIVLLAGVLAWVVLYTKAQLPVPATVREAVSFPVYYPAALPDGFAIDEQSFTASTKVVTFTIHYEQTKKAIVSQQAIPPSFNFDSFHEGMTETKSLSTLVGPAVIGRFEKADLASVVTDKTWILIRAPEGLPQSTMERIIQTLRNE